MTPEPKYGLMERLRGTLADTACEGYVIERQWDEERQFWCYELDVDLGDGDDFENWYPEEALQRI